MKSLIIFILKCEVFLIPVFFLPFTFEIFEFNKQIMLWFLTGLAVIFWSLKTIFIEKKIIYKRTPLDVPILIFLAVWSMSSLLSVDIFSSWFGYYGAFSDSQFSVLSFALFYFLFINTAEKEDLPAFFNTFLYSIIIVLVVSLSSITGVLARLPLIAQFNLVQSNAFYFLGASTQVFSMFAAAIMVFVIALYSYQSESYQKKLSLTIKYYIILITSFFCLILINFSSAWLVLLLGSGVIFIFALYIAYTNREQKTSVIDINITPALILFIVCLLILFSNSGFQNQLQDFFNVSLPQDVVVPVSEGREIAWQGFKNEFLFGAGPGTYAYTYSLYRPESLNNGQFWQLRFDKAPTYIMEMVTSVGFFGVLSYLAVVGVFFFISFVFLKNMFRSAKEESYLAFSFSFAALSMFAAQILYQINISVLFMYWFFIAMAMLSWRYTFPRIFADIAISAVSHRQLFSILRSITVIFILAFIYFNFLQAKYFLADVDYNNFRLTGDRVYLLAAARLNPNRYHYSIALAKDYVNEVRDSIDLLSLPVDVNKDLITEEKKKELQVNIELAIKAAEKATVTAPNSVVTWETLAAIYRDIKSITYGSLEHGINYFDRASALEPTNPVLLTELGKLYSARHQTNDAVNSYLLSIQNKRNYYEAYVGLAKEYEILGQVDKALVMLEEVNIKQSISELIYEAGRLYYNQKKYDKAVERFEEVLQIKPDYANALYSLGLAYQKQGQIGLAIEQFEKVLTLNPDNDGVKKTIAELKNSANVVGIKIVDNEPEGE